MWHYGKVNPPFPSTSPLPFLLILIGTSLLSSSIELIKLKKPKDAPPSPGGKVSSEPPSISQTSQSKPTIPVNRGPIEQGFMGSVLAGNFSDSSNSTIVEKKNEEEEDEKDWPCSNCTLINKHYQVECSVCTEPRSPGIRITPVHQPPPQQFWYCRRCNDLPNELTSSKCIVCGFPKH